MKILPLFIAFLFFGQPVHAQEQIGLTCATWNAMPKATKSLVVYGYMMAEANLKIFVDLVKKKGGQLRQPLHVYPMDLNSLVAEKKVDEYCSVRENISAGLHYAFLQFVSYESQK